MYNKELITQIIPTLSYEFPYSADDYAEHMYFENHHCHKDYSNYGLADSGELIESYITKIKKINSKCLFSGEHGWQGDHIAVYDIAEKVELKYRHSSEVYWVKDRFDQDRSNCHMIIVAKTAKGRKRLNYILSLANTEGFYGRPRIDLQLLLDTDPNDFIVTSACIAGWKYDDAESIWLKIAKHFKNNFFFEVQYHLTSRQIELNKRILRLAEEKNIQIIAGLDSHYISDDGKVKRDVVLKYKGIEYPDEEGWFMDFPDVDVVIQRFKEQGVLSEEQIYRAIMNTNVFVNECEEIKLDKSFKIPNLYKNKTYQDRVKMYHSILNEAYKKEPVKNKDRVAGIKAEAYEITSSGVVDYFLLNHKLIDLAVNKYNGVLTTTSRGSMGSFYTNKLLGYTTLDRFNSDVPIYPDRFIKADRINAGQMPDCDFNIAKQEPFVQAARELLGEHGCYPLMAIEKLKVKTAWKLYAGANDVSPSDAVAISKAIDDYEMKLKHTDDEDKDNVRVEDFIPAQYIDTYNKSLDYRKIMINLKVHACGFLLFDGDIREEIGLVSAVSESTKKRTICACVQGGYLDAFGYVKDDFLIVDAVSLVDELFKSIGQEVPTFETLKEMVKDDSVWNIYERGITCCVNQLENPKTIPKMMKYKAKNIAELSSFIAAIRPGFAPLLNKFLNREPYSTGEPEIDNLLDDTAHWMLYQESIMKVLSFLGVSMGDTYGIIKAISKKKLVGEKKEHLKSQLKESWMNHFGNTDNFNNVWDVIESSASYAFNSPHAYSMAGDSLYQAWFKAHHTSKFYEVAMNHYYEKENKKKIMSLSLEAVDKLGYKRLPFRFRQDNRTFNVDDETKTISSRLDSMKGMSKTAPDLLYNIRDKHYNSFLDFLIKENLDKLIVVPLIKLDYFSEFGKSAKLMDIYKFYEARYDKDKFKKQIKKDKNPYPVEILSKYSKETEKQFNIIDEVGFCSEILATFEDKDLPITERLEAQVEYLGYIEYVNPAAKTYGYILSIDTKYAPKFQIYKLDTGETITVKYGKREYEMSELKEKQVIRFVTYDKPKRKLIDGHWVESEETEPWIKAYKIPNIS
mgnify:CR=1 FL=1